jgi:hypothetical protein
MYTVTCFLLACSGKTALAATIGIESGFPFIKIVSPTLSMLMLHCWGLGCSLSCFFQPWLGLYLFHVRFVCVLGLIKQEKTFLLCAVAFWILVFCTGVWLGTCLWLWRCLISSAAISYVCPMLYTHKSTVETSLISCLCSSLCRLCFQCSVQSSTMLSMHFNGHFREHRRVWEPCINSYTPELYLFHPHIRWFKKSIGSFQQV